MNRVNKPNQSPSFMDMETNQTERKAIVLTPEQRERMKHRSIMGLLRVLGAQAVLTLVIVLLSGWIGGKYAALSALIGAGVYLVPNTLFALRLIAGLLSGKDANVVSFFLGEILKLGAAMMLLVLVVWKLNDWIVWPALLIGLIGVLKGYLVLLATNKLP